MSYVFTIGIIGSIVLLIGAAIPEKRNIKNPVKSLRDWLFAIGAVLMFIYAIFQYSLGGPYFFIILELLIIIASVLMMLNTPDAFDTYLISLITIGFIIWSLVIFQGYLTIVFILGLCLIGLGYAFKINTSRRYLALVMGSLLVAFFSYLMGSWIFFGLNFLFAAFCGWYYCET